MKTLLALSVLCVVLSAAGYSQQINWRALNDDQRNIVQLNLGYDFGMTAQIGYSRSLGFPKPLLVGIEYSFPMGSDLVDDFKVRLGAQMEVVNIGGVSAAVKASSLFRSYHTDLVRILDFGSDFAAVVGYYHPAWYFGGEFGFDKAITSHINHSDLMRAFFPGARDGWYVSTGGHFYYGLQAGTTIGGSFDISLRAGATKAQMHDENATLPRYVQLGLGVRF